MASEVSTFESRGELEIGLRLPPPFDRMIVSKFLRRTSNGGWLYEIKISMPIDAEPGYSCAADSCDDPNCSQHGAWWAEWRKQQ